MFCLVLGVMFLQKYFQALDWPIESLDIVPTDFIRFISVINSVLSFNVNPLVFTQHESVFYLQILYFNLCQKWRYLKMSNKG